MIQYKEPETVGNRDTPLRPVWRRSVLNADEAKRYKVATLIKCVMW